MFWLREGDKNTKFFHANATARKKTNHISFLETEEGDRVDSLEDICKVVKEYSTQVFVDPGEGVPNVASSSPRIVAREHNLKLTKEVSFDKFTVAVKQMHPDKASGPDGLNPTFYQNS